MLLPIFLSIFLALSLIGNSAKAESPQGTSSVLDQLHERGIDNVGNWDLHALSQRIVGNVKWKVTSTPPPQVIAGNRKCASYSPGEVSIFSECLNSGKDLSCLKLHESLGALGLPDQNYLYSSGLCILANSNQTQVKELAREYGIAYFNSDRMTEEGSGINSVGGGGDENALEAKMDVLTKLLKDFPASQLSFMGLFPEISFEPMYTPSEQRVAIQYQLNLAQKSREHFTVLVPVSRLSSETLTNEIAEKLGLLFPNGKGRFVDDVPSTCHPDLKPTFPPSQDATVKQIQDVRANALSGCLSVLPAHFSAMVPAIQSWELPQAGDKKYYLCTYTIGADQGEFLLEMPQKSALVGHGITLSDGTDLTAGLVVNDRGVIASAVAWTRKDPTLIKPFENKSPISFQLSAGLYSQSCKAIAPPR